MKAFFFATITFILIALPGLAQANSYTHFSCVTKVRVILVDLGINEKDQSITIILKKDGGAFGAETLSFGGWTGPSEVLNFQRSGDDLSEGYSAEVINLQTSGTISLTRDGRMKIDLTDPAWSYSGLVNECQLSVQ